MKFLHLTPQPNFPHEDITATNREVVSSLLLEPAYANSAHELAEQQVVFYKIGHQALGTLASALQMDMYRDAAFSYGAATYEMIALTVRPLTIPDYAPKAIYEKVGDLLSMQADGFEAGLRLVEHEERMSEDAPNMTQVVNLAAELQPQFDPRLVRMGAAMERSIERQLGGGLE